MTLVRSRKARILEKAGLRYVAGWLDADEAQAVLDKIDAAKPRVVAVVLEAGE